MWGKNNITEKVYFVCFEHVTYKKRKNECKALHIGKQKDITRNVYNECFIVSRQKTQKHVYMEKHHRYQNPETHE